MVDMTRSKAAALYRARYTFDSVSGMWEVEIAEIPQVHTFGRTLEKAEEHVRDALALWLQVPEQDLHLRHEYDLADDVSDAVMASIEERGRVSEATERAARLTQEAARKLTSQLGLSMRDTARVLQLSHQRVSQILGENLRTETS
jgi:predicted RNase H-like HicB family nuclease